MAAEAAYNRLLSRIDEFAETIPALSKVTKEEWPFLFDENGRMKDPDMFRKR